MARPVFFARVGCVDLFGRSSRIVREHRIDFARAPIGLDVLGAVHGRGLEQIRREARVDHHIGLRVEAVLWRQRTFAEDEGQPGKRAVLVVTRDRQRAFREQPLVVGAIVLAIAVATDEAIDVLEARVVAGVEHNAAVLIDDALCAFVAETAERGVLDRRRGRIARIDLDDPAEAVRFVRLLVDVEARIVAPPAVPRARDAVARPAPLLSALGRGLILWPVRHEVAVEILLRRQVRAPGCVAARTIVERAEDAQACRIGRCSQACMAGGGAVERHGRRCRDAAVGFAFEDGTPALAFAHDLDDGHAMRGHLDSNVCFGDLRKVCARDALDPGEHDFGIDVLVIDAHKATIARVPEREERDVVVVVAEAPCLILAGQLARIERCHVWKERITPTEQDVRRIALGDMMALVETCGKFAKARRGECLCPRRR